ncbi:MAG: HesA/MoeB/ThiF family protein [Porcipelethomonas sp.]
MILTPEQIERYSRQLIIKEIGVSGQKKLSESSVLIIGMGGLGSPAAMYLTAAGVGTLGLADGDCVVRSNLQRQVIHNESGIGQRKTESARNFLHSLNSSVNFVCHDTYLDEENILETIKDYDFIIDASDRIENKFLINDACVIGKKPFSHGAVLQFGGQTMTYVPQKSPCYRCVFEDIPDVELPSCSQAGIIGMAGGIIGTVQALEAVKYLLGTGDLLTGRMLIFDGLEMKFRTAGFSNPNSACRVCGKNADIKNLSWYRSYHGGCNRER